MESKKSLPEEAEIMVLAVGIPTDTDIRVMGNNAGFYPHNWWVVVGGRLMVREPSGMYHTPEEGEDACLRPILRICENGNRIGTYFLYGIGDELFKKVTPDRVLCEDEIVSCRKEDVVRLLGEWADRSGISF